MSCKQAIRERERQAQAAAAAEDTATKDNKEGKESREDAAQAQDVQEFSAERPPLPTYNEGDSSSSNRFHLKVVGLDSASFSSLENLRVRQVCGNH